MNLKDMIMPTVRNMPPSGIRKYFDLLNEMKDAISLGVGSRISLLHGPSGRLAYIRWKKAIPIIRPTPASSS